MSPHTSPARPDLVRRPAQEAIAQPRPNYLRMSMRELRVHANRLYQALDTQNPPEKARYEYRLVSAILLMRADLARHRLAVQAHTEA